MRTSLITFFGIVVMSPLYFIFLVGADAAGADGKSTLQIEELDPVTKQVIQDSLQQLHDRYGARGLGFQDEPDAQKDISKVRGLGFDSIDQLSKATIGQGFPLYVVRLDTLRSYDKGTDPWSLLAKTAASIYPLLVLQGTSFEARSSATVSFQQGQEEKTKILRVAEMGNPELIRLLTEARMELQKEGSCRLSSECFAVSVPALGLHLFGYRDDGTKGFKIVTLNHVHGHVKKEDFRAAKDVLEELSNQAKKLKDSPSGRKPNEIKSNLVYASLEA